MKKFDKYEVDNSVMFIKNIEDILNQIPILNYNETTIELPNMVLITKEDTSLLYNFLNPGTNILTVDEKTFDDIMAAINLKNKDENIIVVDRKVKPKTLSRINLNILKSKMVFYKEESDTIACNETLFTTSALNFHGTGMFTSRRHTFLVSDEEMEKIKNYLKE